MSYIMLQHIWLIIDSGIDWKILEIVINMIILFTKELRKTVPSG